MKIDTVEDTVCSFLILAELGLNMISEYVTMNEPLASQFLSRNVCSNPYKNLGV